MRLNILGDYAEKFYMLELQSKLQNYKELTKLAFGDEASFEIVSAFFCNLLEEYEEVNLKLCEKELEVRINSLEKHLGLDQAS